MKSNILIAVSVSTLVGCATIVAPLASDFITSTGETVRIAYANPDKALNCTIKGTSEFNPNTHSIAGVFSIGDDDAEVERRINSTFAEKAVTLGANYINRGFAGSNSFGGVYERSSTVEAAYFHCETLPTL
ncbi:hypothetical protein [Ferrimonas sp. YFM]|uniref:hypothetical protein n=1 Tax=Ferrimonas sp. YFM TaxID=3028878 RepID=UPI0025725270|nr:hypothetical protein [Ferrimonas sp. YFM]BDY05252.1 hypothetical protein F0521_22930 [Ferrimonas sp. YFM]